MRPQVQERGELADLLDQDEEARLLRAFRRGGLAPLFLFGRRRHLGDCLGLEAPEVGVIAREIPAAAIALSAGSSFRIFVLAEHELRHGFGELELADAARTVEQDGVRQAIHAGLQRIKDRLVPGMHQRPCSADLIWSRTEATSPDASTTRTRFGSSFAIAR